MPARDGSTDRDAPEAGGKLAELAGLGRGGDHRADPAAGDAIGQIRRTQQGRGGDHDRAQLHRRQHGLPKGYDIAQHQQDALAAPDAEAPQVIGDLVRAPAEIGEGEPALGPGVIDDPKRGSVLAILDPIEIVERPVEPRQARPAEGLIGGRIVVAMAHQEIARRQEFVDIGHGSSPGGRSSSCGDAALEGLNHPACPAVEAAGRALVRRGAGG
jgi:hypothetical protein